MTGTESLADRREAVVELGASMRALTEAVVLTEVETAELRAVAAAARDLADRLGRRRRSIRQIPAVDDLAAGIRHFSAGTGTGHPVSPPLRTSTGPDGALTGRAVLGARLEGPPGMLHGGMIALLFDEMLGWAAAHAHAHGMTATLEVSYLRAVPLDREIVITAWVTRQEGRKVWTGASMACSDAPDTPVATAKALFVSPRAELREQYFSRVTDAAGGAVPPSDSWQAPTA